MTDENEKLLLEMQQTYLQPAVQELINLIDKLCGYTLPRSIQNIITEFNTYTSNPDPSYKTRLIKGTKGDGWWQIHIGGIAWHMPSALSCVLYHRDNIVRIEEEVKKLRDNPRYKGVMPDHSVMALSWNHTLKLDAEYQACILAMRRCLEYLTAGLHAYFKDENRDFRNLSKVLQAFVKKDDSLTPVATALTEIHQIWKPKLNSLVKNGNKTSTRDKISHYEHVKAGHFNLTKDGLKFFGGEENISTGVESPTSLSSVLNSRIDDLISCMTDLIKTFIEVSKSEKDVASFQVIGRS